MSDDPPPAADPPAAAEASGDGFVEPAYHARSLVDVLPAVARCLGLRLNQHPAPDVGPLPLAPAYVVLLVDGLGADLLERHAQAAPFLAEHRLATPPLTAGVPSTTATSLTSLGTGLPPGTHGVVGFTSRIPGSDRLLNALQWSKDVDPEEWQPHPTAFAILRAAGATVTVVNKREFRGSGLTVASQRGAEFVGADRVGEKIASAVAVSAASPSLTYLYEGDLDWTGHRYGVASSAWLQQLAMVDAVAEQLRDALPQHVRLLVLADHGMVDGSSANRVDVDQETVLRDGVALLGGEARFRHVYCHRGAVDDVVATWSEVLGDRAVVLPRDLAADRGWFGRLDPRVRARVGDVVVACRGDTAIMSSTDFPYEATMVGLHGSLTPEEMLIPLILA